MTRKLALVPLLTLLGCSPDGTRTPQNAGGADMRAVPPADMAVAPDLSPSASGVKGVVKNEAGAPLDGVPIAACTAAWCEYGKSLSDGSFFIPTSDESVDLIVKVIEDDLAARAEAVAPVHLPGGATVDAGVLFTPSLPAGAMLGPTPSDPQTIVAGDGLSLTLRRADLEPPLGATDANIAARAVPLAHVPPLPGIDPANLVAVYALAPFSMASRSKIAVRAPSSLPAGTAVQFRSISELDGKLSPPEPGRADGSSVATDAGAGLVDLTWLVISK